MKQMILGVFISAMLVTCDSLVQDHQGQRFNNTASTYPVGSFEAIVLEHLAGTEAGQGHREKQIMVIRMRYRMQKFSALARRALPALDLTFGS